MMLDGTKVMHRVVCEACRRHTCDALEFVRLGIVSAEHGRLNGQNKCRQLTANGLNTCFDQFELILKALNEQKGSAMVVDEVQFSFAEDIELLQFFEFVFEQRVQSVCLKRRYEHV